RLVFVDLGEGRFRPQEIRVGAEANGMYEVLSGLRPGDAVAVSGIFLIAAEARISTAAKYWDDTGAASESDHGEEPGPLGGASAAPSMPGMQMQPSPPAHSMSDLGAKGRMASGPSAQPPQAPKM